MVLSRDKAVATAQSIYNDQRTVEQRRLQRIRRALQPAALRSANESRRPSEQNLEPALPDELSVYLPADADPAMRTFAKKSRTNYLPLALDQYAAALIVHGYRVGRAADNVKQWDYWQANGLDARQTGIHRHALAYGVAYGVVLPGDSNPVIRGKSPLNLTALYGDPVDDEWPMFGLQVDGDMWRLYDEEAVYFIGKEPTTGPTFIEAREHDLGVCPIVRYRDRMLLEGDPMGIIEPLIPIQSRIDETNFNLLVAQFYAAFKQRYIIGWVPSTEEEKLKPGASIVWTFEDSAEGDNAIKAGEFAESNLANYISSGTAARRDFASISQLPIHDIAPEGVANLSAEALAALEAGKERMTGELKTSLGESHEQMFALAARAAGDEAPPADAQVRWKDVSARSLAQTVDALGKMASTLNMPVKWLWTRLPDVTDQDLAELERLAAEDDSVARLMAELERQAEPPSEQ